MIPKSIYSRIGHIFGGRMKYRMLTAGVVNLLMGDGETTPKGIETTALEMVRTGRLQGEEKADGTVTVRIVPQTADSAPLRPVEELMVERIRRRCRSGVDRVPIGALGPGDGDEFWVWWRGFQNSVRNEATALGLIRSARNKYVTLLYRGAALAAWFGALWAGVSFSPEWMRIILKAVLVLSLLGLVRLSDVPLESGPRLTAAGRQAAREWRTHDRAGEHRLPKRQVGAAGPESALPVREPQRIWSAYGRSWHVVDAGPLDTPRWGHLWQLVLLALAVCAAFGTLVAVTLTAHRPALAWEWDTAPLLAGVLLWGLWLPARRRVLAVPDEASFRGAVISRWDYDTHYDDPYTDITHYCCSIEDPATRKAWSFEVDQWSRPMFSRAANPELKDRFRVGDVVDVHCSPRRRKIHQISLVEAVSRTD
ncbi:hypothetical protein ABZ619_36365 [Streptomyces sp. NPDC007851]|uniref:DUF2207 family protein n=1 Tax=Streptomyces sp. NPDC007851 TaxID=3155008 RepID=UPI0033C64D1A